MRDDNDEDGEMFPRDERGVDLFLFRYRRQLIITENTKRYLTKKKSSFVAQHKLSASGHNLPLSPPRPPNCELWNKSLTHLNKIP